MSTIAKKIEVARDLAVEAGRILRDDSIDIEEQVKYNPNWADFEQRSEHMFQLVQDYKKKRDAWEKLVIESEHLKDSPTCIDSIKEFGRKICRFIKGLFA